MHKNDFIWIILTAMAIIFGTVIDFPILPQGGSVSLDALFMFLILFNFGFKRFFISVIANLVVVTLVDVYFLNIIQWFFDYPAPMLALGLGYLIIKPTNLTKEIVIIVIGFILKYICHVISGVFFFAEYAPEGQTPLFYSLTANLSYVLPSLIFTIIVFVALKKVNLVYFVKNN